MGGSSREATLAHSPPPTYVAPPSFPLAWDLPGRGWGALILLCLWGSPAQKDIMTLNKERFDFSLNLFPAFKQFHSLVAS